MAAPLANAPRTGIVHAAVRDMAWCTLVISDAIAELEALRPARIARLRAAAVAA